ncbi:hypothetical protein JXA02_02300 [candidate division KSB1 bacterium]|nr:hypothetical protein [candidate division KSB1 bacterium]RQW10433.1 MAG: hypothetical protein EH222_02525 [candidate division KSB1 bacterium]
MDKERIHSAGLDVFEDEPPEKAQAPLLRHPRVIATGHYAWHSNVTSVAQRRRAADNMIALLTGKKTEDCLNPSF